MFYILFSVIVAVTHAASVDLFHNTQQAPSKDNDHMPTLIRPANAPSNSAKPETSTPINLRPANEGEFFDVNEFVPYRSSRHDEFDWALTKVSSIDTLWPSYGRNIL